MTTSAASSKFETYTKEQLLYFYGIVNILLIYVYNKATVGWQLVHHTVYGTKKSDNGLGDYCFSSSHKLYSGLAAIQYLYIIIPVGTELTLIVDLYSEFLFHA